MALTRRPTRPSASLQRITYKQPKREYSRSLFNLSNYKSIDVGIHECANGHSGNQVLDGEGLELLVFLFSQRQTLSHRIVSLVGIEWD